MIRNLVLHQLSANIHLGTLERVRDLGQSTSSSSPRGIKCGGSTTIESVARTFNYQTLCGCNPMAETLLRPIFRGVREWIARRSRGASCATNLCTLFSNCSFDFWNQPEGGGGMPTISSPAASEAILSTSSVLARNSANCGSGRLVRHPRSWTAAPLAAPLPTISLPSSATSDDRGLPPARGRACVARCRDVRSIIFARFLSTAWSASDSAKASEMTTLAHPITRRWRLCADALAAICPCNASSAGV